MDSFSALTRNLTVGIFLFLLACSPSRSARKAQSGTIKYDIELDLTKEGEAMAETFATFDTRDAAVMRTDSMVTGWALDDWVSVRMN